ncbi:hypothetical protein M407DRAFT_29606 [Tulasnella calospora MUT 4182]|uniref:Uncharacterized protein n=1 Tax=Tulasnella calospora MUT 4182 TaxID=1051891 RepID=A0A0C3Q8Q3_9AGAM|nr:hypothetical protein M407DRAFT_29606 [Tulasnella calospora MUT 4182]
MVQGRPDRILTLPSALAATSESPLATSLSKMPMFHDQSSRRLCFGFGFQRLVRSHLVSANVATNVLSNRHDFRIPILTDFATVDQGAADEKRDEYGKRSVNGDETPKLTGRLL